MKGKKNGKFPYRFVEIIWRDTHSDSKWFCLPEDRLPEPVTVYSRGWLISENKKQVTIAASIITEFAISDNRIGDVSTIPRGCIDSIKDCA